MLKEMQASGLDSADSGGGAGAGDEEEFSKMLMGMMEQLTNKEILYEPMKELHDKFPAWMERSRGKVGEEDWKRYEVQRGLVGEIVERFERKGYSDADAGDREFIVERMQKVSFFPSSFPDCGNCDGHVLMVGGGVVDASCGESATGFGGRYEGCSGGSGRLGFGLCAAMTGYWMILVPVYCL